MCSDASGLSQVGQYSPSLVHNFVVKTKTREWNQPTQKSRAARGAQPTGRVDGARVEPSPAAPLDIPGGSFYLYWVRQTEMSWDLAVSKSHAVKRTTADRSETSINITDLGAPSGAAVSLTHKRYKAQQVVDITDDEMDLDVSSRNRRYYVCGIS